MKLNEIDRMGPSELWIYDGLCCHFQLWFSDHAVLTYTGWALALTLGSGSVIDDHLVHVWSSEQFLFRGSFTLPLMAEHQTVKDENDNDLTPHQMKTTTKIKAATSRNWKRFTCMQLFPFLGNCRHANSWAFFFFLFHSTVTGKCMYGNGSDGTIHQKYTKILVLK